VTEQTRYRKLTKSKFIVFMTTTTTTTTTTPSLRRSVNTASSTRGEIRRGSLSVFGAVVGLLRWLPCVGRSQRLVGPTPSLIGSRPSSSLQLPPMPLTQRELFIVVRSWKSIQSEITETGMRMFLRYTKSYSCQHPSPLHKLFHSGLKT